jgi:peptidoglycan/LPS O-acetylase OafA/YrhL
VNNTHAAERTTTSFGQIPALDGLRAVAVLSVVGYHYGMFGLSGGFLGVDLFFVLSGFLITSLLIAEADSTGRVNLKAFWVRRFKRLMPAALVTITAVAIWAAFEVDAMQLSSIRADLLATLGYVANWRFIYSGQSYFEQFSLASPVRHAWSLAIEEQFYVVWPVLFALIYKWRRKLILAGVVAIAAIASALWMAAIFDPDNISRVYYGTDTRASQLLIGVLLAVVVSGGHLKLGNVSANVLSVGSLAVVLFAMFTVSDQNENLYKGGLVLFAVAAAVLLFTSSHLRSGPLHFILCSAPFQFVGRISYGLYLWHWPVQIMLTEHSTDLIGWQLTALRLVVSFAITYVSYRLIEMPLRYSKWSGWMTWRSLVILPVTLAVAAGVILVSTSGAKDKPAYMDATPGEVITATTIAPLITTTTVLGDVPLGKVLLIGDSVAASLQVGFAQSAAEQGIEFQSLTRPGCAIIRGQPAADGQPLAVGFNCEEGLEQYLRESILPAGAKTILWMSTWEGGSRILGDVYYEAGTSEFVAMQLREFKRSIDVITSQGARVIFLTYPPAIDYDNELGFYQNAEGRKMQAALNDFYVAYAKKHPKQSAVLEFSEIACPGGYPCVTTLDGIKLRPRDGRHFTDESSKYLGLKMFPALQRVLNSNFR